MYPGNPPKVQPVSELEQRKGYLSPLKQGRVLYIQVSDTCPNYDIPELGTPEFVHTHKPSLEIRVKFHTYFLFSTTLRRDRIPTWFVSHSMSKDQVQKHEQSKSKTKLHDLTRDQGPEWRYHLIIQEVLSFSLSILTLWLCRKRLRFTLYQRIKT